ncbi:hypothetical protein BofuT4_uP084230.1 [Botrytis cinerea T4]|uniref:Uncharacterized protein n=1 Tax=Botryotinia fuckeliana (strain T4) TaxID=999810 RepID=G2YJI2_BOTF4|nr:hypothetical protein BofuT4_uP084230.1 [Botrytis cinerea T4]
MAHEISFSVEDERGLKSSEAEFDEPSKCTRPHDKTQVIVRIDSIVSSRSVTLQ